MSIIGDSRRRRLTFDEFADRRIYGNGSDLSNHIDAVQVVLVVGCGIVSATNHSLHWLPWLVR